MAAIQLGPLVLSGERFTALLALAALVVGAELLARRQARQRGRERLSNWGWNVVLVGLLGARVGFVLTHLGAYLAAPATILYVWQGGFSLWWGVAAGALYTAWLWRSDLAGLRLTLLPALAAIVVWGAAGLLLASGGSGRASSLPPLTLADLEGQPVALASLAGEPLVVNLWATWCGPCQRELPMLVDVAQTRSDVRFALVDQGEDAARVRAYLEARDLAPPLVLLDPQGALATAFRSRGLPTTLFFSADGELQRLHVGEISRAALLDGLKLVGR